MPDRPRLTPAVADVRRAVRAALALIPPAPEGGEGSAGRPVGEQPEALVACSGGPDSLALALAAGFEASRAGRRLGAVVVDHGLQPDSAAIAERAAREAERLGLAPVLVRRVHVGAGGGPEAAARAARYAAFADAMATTGASRVLLAHTLDDQAETVLLGLARGSGPDALAGMRLEAPPYLRPLLGVRRATTRQACIDAGLDPHDDPHNADRRFTRVRVRQEALPALERALGPGVAEALARTADQVQEDAAALDALAAELAPEIAEHIEAGLALPVDALAVNPAALVHRLVRLAAEGEFGVTLTRAQTREVARLVSDWHGQGPVELPRLRVERLEGRLRFTAR
jgi:tRNA(Ile)-lysidine synthase